MSFGDCPKLIAGDFFASPEDAAYPVTDRQCVIRAPTVREWSKLEATLPYGRGSVSSVRNQARPDESGHSETRVTPRIGSLRARVKLCRVVRSENLCPAVHRRRSGMSEFR